MSIDAYFDRAELREIMQSVPAETEELVRTTIARVTSELAAGRGTLRARLLELADTLDGIGPQLHEARRPPAGSRPCPFAELAGDVRHAA